MDDEGLAEQGLHHRCCPYDHLHPGRLFFAPYLIKRHATRFARESLKCPVLMEEVRLNELARERAEAIKQEFVAAGTIDEGRLTILEPSTTEEEADETVSSELTLDVRR